MILSKWKLIGAGLAALALVTMIGLGYRHYTGLVAKVAALEADKRALELAGSVNQETIQTQADTLLEWQESAAHLERELEVVRAAEIAARAETRRLNAIFAEHDLTRLTLAKPGLVERRVNAGTARMFELLERASAAGGEPDRGSSPPREDHAPAPGADSAGGGALGSPHQ